MRSFTSNFQMQCIRQTGAAPYLVLEIDWNGIDGGGQAYGPAYYLDRPATSFTTTDGKRIPGSGSIIGNSLVTSWGQTSLDLSENAVGFQNQTSVTLEDNDGELYNILNAQAQQRVKIFIWRMFDDPSVVWGTDNAIMLAGILRPFDWKQTDNGIVLSIGDVGPLLTRDVSCRVTGLPSGGPTSILETASIDKCIPLVWGQTYRVPAIPLYKTFMTVTTQAMQTGSLTAGIRDDPAQYGIAGYTCMATVGSDVVSITLGTNPPTVTLNVSGTTPPANQCVGTVTSSPNPPGPSPIDMFLVQYAINPYIRPADFVAEFTVGSPLQVWLNTINSGAQAGGLYNTTISSISYDGFGGYDIQDSAGLWQYAGYQTQLGFSNPGQPTGAGNVRQYPAGTAITCINSSGVQSPFIYACNAMPSKGVAWVEGYGDITDNAGQGRKDFIVIGQTVFTALDGTITVTGVGNAPYTINLDDSSYFTYLGRNITTVTFNGAPRTYNKGLESDDIWVTMLGLDDVDGYIVNPAFVIKEYLTNPKLMNVSPASINTNAFLAAANKLNQYSFGFAQLEPKNGLQQIQDLSAQCNSVLFFDQGVANIVVLENSFPGSGAAWTFINGNVLQGSLEYSESSVDSVVNHIVANWRQYWDDITGSKMQQVKLFDLPSIAAFGDMPRTTQIDALWNRGQVQGELQFWLTRWSTIWRIVRFMGFLDALILQPGDWFFLSFTDGEGRQIFNATPMFVTKTSDNGPPDHTVSIEARYPAFTY